MDIGEDLVGDRKEALLSKAAFSLRRKARLPPSVRGSGHARDRHMLLSWRYFSECVQLWRFGHFLLKKQFTMLAELMLG